MRPKDIVRPWLSIRTKLITAFVGLSVAPVVFVGLYGLSSNISTMKSIALANLTHDVHTIRERGSNFLAGVESDLRVLRASTHVGEYVTHPGAGRDAEILRQIETDLLSFAKTKEIYYRLRIVNMERDEVLRVQASNDSGPPRGYRIIPQTELRSGGETYYFLLTGGLEPGQIAFSPAELLPAGHRPIPVISFAMILGDRDRRAGLLIADVYATGLYAVMRSERGFGANEKVILVGDEGHYLYRSDSTESWNNLIASRETSNLEKDYPPAVAQQIVSNQEGAITDGTDEFIVHAPLFTVPGTAVPGQDLNSFTEALYVFETVPATTVTAAAREFAWTFGGFLVLLLLSAIGLGLMATLHFTRPIAEVQEGADIIAKGRYGHRLNVQTHDEIERLAAQFNTMAAALEAHEQEIQRHRMQLEDMVQHRTAELAEEKSKLQAVLDNVPSAFVVLDPEFRIQTASASFSTVTGLRFEEVRGQDCRTVYRSRGICTGPENRRDVLAGAAEGHIDRTVDGKGGFRFIEHTTIPIMELDRVGSILEIFTDVTKRKQLEQHLIQSEKLMATGEMAAIIAHEFRNALTSIKMILQLQQESEHLPKADKKSLSVALDSIYHMETVVRELLNFARPTPMEFRAEYLGTLVDECIAFAQLRVHRQNIGLRKSVLGVLPPVRVDAPHLKEAVINILLNAIQAIESDGARSGRGEITISLRCSPLGRTVRDFDTTELQGSVGSDGTEIVLPEGGLCVFITIADNGPGIAPENLRRIFDPFFTTKPNGTGLGLSMVKRTVNAHGGVVTVSSESGVGSTFEICLPVPGESPVAESPAALREHAGSLESERRQL